MSTNCWNHGSVAYRFIVDGRTYENVSYWVDRPCSEIRKGDALVVYYDPTSPGTNTTMLPFKARDHYSSEFDSLVLFALLATLVLGFRFARNARKTDQR